MILILVGKQATGKSTIANKLSGRRLITYTTRPKRPGEINGVDYYFISEQEFFKYINDDQFLEWCSYDTVGGKWYYGSLKEDYYTADFVILNPIGLKAVKKAGIPYLGVLLTCTEEEQAMRLLNRGDDPSEVKRRIEADNKDFEGIDKLVDVVIDTTNITVDDAVSAILRRVS